MKRKSGKSGVSRRDFLKTGALAGAAVATGGGALTASVVSATEKSKRRRKRGSLVLVNGRIHTMDDRGSVVSAVAIRGGRFVEVGHGARDVENARVIDLRGKTVVPGLIESHTHFVSLANRPGYHVAQWELASNIADVLAALKARRARGDVPAGAVHHRDGRGRAEHLARAPHAHARRARFRRARPAGVPVPGRRRAGARSTRSARSSSRPRRTRRRSGTVDRRRPDRHDRQRRTMANRALYHLRIRQTFEDKQRSCTRRAGVLGERRPHHGPRPDAGRGVDGDAHPRRSTRSRLTGSPPSTTTACTTRGSRCTPRATT